MIINQTGFRGTRHFQTNPNASQDQSYLDPNNQSLQVFHIQASIAKLGDETTTLATDAKGWAVLLSMGRAREAMLRWENMRLEAMGIN